MRKKFFVWFFVVLAVAVLAGGAFWGHQWLGVKKQKVALGLSEPNFPYRDRTVEELGRLFPQTRYADVATRVTPEETYAKFRQGLKDNNLDMVLAQLSTDSERYQENMAALTKAYGEGRFKEIFGKYPEKIDKVWVGDTIAQYEFKETDEGHLTSYSVEFLKDQNGDWKLDIL